MTRRLNFDPDIPLPYGLSAASSKKFPELGLMLGKTDESLLSWSKYVTAENSSRNEYNRLGKTDEKQSTTVGQNNLLIKLAKLMNVRERL